MGGLSSALAPIIQIGSALGSVANTVAPFYKDSVNRDQQKATNALASKQAQAKAALDGQAAALSDQKDENKRRIALKHAIANQRASFGGQGIDPSDGSSEAVLLGLFNESDQERALREQMAGIRNAAIDQNAGAIQQKNLLEQSQAMQKDTINRLSDLF